MENEIMTDDKWTHYAIRGAEDDLLDWGEKKRAVLALKNDNEGNNELIEKNGFLRAWSPVSVWMAMTDLIKKDILVGIVCRLDN